MFGRQGRGAPAHLKAVSIVCLCCPQGQFIENDKNEIAFRSIPSNILERVCTYLYYRVRYTNSSQEIPEFQIPPGIALELLMVRPRARARTSARPESANARIPGPPIDWVMPEIKDAVRWGSLPTAITEPANASIPGTVPRCAHATL